MTLEEEIRTSVLVSPRGMIRIPSGGWSIVFTGGPNDALGNLSSPPIWRLSGKRIDGRRPSAQNLDYLRRIAVAAGALNVPGEELIQGTWHWSWNEVGGRPVPVETCSTPMSPPPQSGSARTSLTIGAGSTESSGPSWWQWLLAPIPTYLMSSDEPGKRKTADQVPAWVWIVSGGILAGAGIVGYKKVVQQ